MEAVKRVWVAMGWRPADVDAGELACKGCSRDNACAYPAQRDCAFSRNLGNCGQCRDYPCMLVVAACERTAKALAQPAVVGIAAGDRDELTAAFGRKRQNLDREHAARTE